MFNRFQGLPLVLRDQRDLVSITWDNLYAYCGPTQVIATSLFYRLCEQAFRELSPVNPPDREETAFLTAFPGRGILECAEAVLRLPSLAPERLTLDIDAGPEDAPPAFAGRFYFEIQIAGRRRGYVPTGDYLDDEFRKQVADWQHTELDEGRYGAYMDFKWKKAQSLMNHEGNLFSSFDRPAPPLPPARESWFGMSSYEDLYASLP